MVLKRYGTDTASQQPWILPNTEYSFPFLFQLFVMMGGAGPSQCLPLKQSQHSAAPAACINLGDQSATNFKIWGYDSGAGRREVHISSNLSL